MKVDGVPIRESLSYRQARNCLLVALCIGIVLSSIQISLDYSNYLSEVYKRVDQLLVTAKRTATHAAFNLNESSANELVKGLLSYGPIVEVSLRDDFGDLLASSKQDEKGRADIAFGWVFGDLKRMEFELEAPALSQTPVGSLLVVIDPAVTGEGFIERSLLVLMLGVVKAILITIVIVYVIYLTIIKSLLNIAVSLMKSSQLEKIPVSKNHKNDEIGVLVKAFNMHLDVIEGQHSVIVDINENMEGLIEKRTHQLAEKNAELKSAREVALKVGRRTRLAPVGRLNAGGDGGRSAWWQG